MQLEIHHYVQIISLVAVIYYWRSLRPNNLEGFLLIIPISLATELIGKYVRSIGWPNNYAVYNIYLMLTTPCWMYVFGRMLDLKGRAAQVYIALSVLIVALVVGNYFFFQGSKVFNNYSIILLMLASIAFSALNLFRLAFISDLRLPLTRQPLFWINAVVLLFAMVSIVVFGLQQYIVANKIQILNKTVYRAIMPTVNVILYLIYTYAFYLCHQKTKHSLSSSPL